MSSRGVLVWGGLLVALAVVYGLWTRSDALVPAAPAEAAPVVPASGAIDAAVAAAAPDPRRVVPEATSRRQFRGVVRARDDDTPVAGAELRLFGRGRRDDSTRLTTLRTDAVGRFAVDAPPAWPDSVQVELRAPGFRSMSSGLDVARESELRMCWVAELFGRVLDEATGAPVAGARVSSSGGDATVADATGHYRLKGVNVGIPSYLRVVCEGYAPTRIDVFARDRSPSQVDVRLTPGIAVRAHVVDRATGVPLPAARWSRSGSDSQPVDPEDAGFTVFVVPGVELVVSVEAETYCRCLWSWSMAASDEPGEPRLPLTRQATIEGVVVDAAGQPVVDAWVSWWADGGDLAAVAPDTLARFGVPGSLHDREDREGQTVRTDRLGRYRLSLVPNAAPRHVECSVKERGVARAEPRVIDVPGSSVSVDLRLERRATVRGTARRNGEPFRGLVSWMVGDQRGGDWIRDGRFEFRYVPAGPLRLFPGRSPDQHGVTVELDVEAGATYERDLVWEEPEGEISGRVTTADGRPLEGVWITALNAAGPGRPRRDGTDADGFYRLEALVGPPQDLLVRHGVLTEQRSGVEVGATDVDFVLPELGSLWLQLLEADTRQPLASSQGILSRSLVWRRSGETEWLSGPRPRVDTQGRLELELPIGHVDVLLRFQKSGYRPRTVTSLAVTAGASPPVPVLLERGLDLEVRLQGGAGANVAERGPCVLFALETAQVGKVRVAARGAPDQNARVNGVHLHLDDPGLLQQMLRSSQGATTLRGLVPGSYTVRAFPDVVELTPSSFRVREPRTAVDVRWRWR
ncbi:MAG: carboxypeptidase-like regulatory domain-containing protein [Planctomycetota bacterium]